MKTSVLDKPLITEQTLCHIINVKKIVVWIVKYNVWFVDAYSEVFSFIFIKMHGKILLSDGNSNTEKGSLH